MTNRRGPKVPKAITPTAADVGLGAMAGPKPSAQQRDLWGFFVERAETIAVLLKDVNDIATVMDLLVEAADTALDSRIARAEEMLRNEGRKPTRTELTRLRTASHYAFEEIAQAAKDVGDAFYEDGDPFPAEKALTNAPPPYTKPRALSVSDAKRLIECATDIAAGSAFSHSELALFLQAMLPHFKGAEASTVLIRTQHWYAAALFACGKGERREQLLEACARIFVRVHDTGHFESKWYPAQYALVPEGFVFDDAAPPIPMSHDDKASHQARWLVLSAMAVGDFSGPHQQG